MSVHSFFIVTPVYNGEKSLRRTFDSVLIQAQEGSVAIAYHVQDGGSTDGTMALCAQYQEIFKRAGITFTFKSEPDDGMYDALAKAWGGGSPHSYDYYAYINAGDYYAPRAFANVGSAFARGGCSVITGINVIYNVSGDIVSARLPGLYHKLLFGMGLHGLFLPFVQQESTFWTGSAHRLIDLQRLSSFRLAGDFYIWRTLSRHFRFHVLCCWLSGFTVEPGQLSQVHRDRYFSEVRSLSSFSFHGLLLLPLACVHWYLPDKLKKILLPSLYIEVSGCSK